MRVAWVLIGMAVMVVATGLDSSPADARTKRIAGKPAAVAPVAGRPLKLHPTGRAAAKALHRPGKATPPRQNAKRLLKSTAPLARAHRFGRPSVRQALRKRPAPFTTGLAVPGSAVSIALTPQQVRTIHRAIVEEPLQPRPVPTESVHRPPVAPPILPAPPDAASNPANPSAAIEVGSPVPPGVALRDLPASAVAAAPKIEGYRYAIVGERVLLVEPSTGTVIADLRQ